MVLSKHDRVIGWCCHFNTIHHFFELYIKVIIIYLSTKKDAGAHSPRRFAIQLFMVFSFDDLEGDRLCDLNRSGFLFVLSAEIERDHGGHHIHDAIGFDVAPERQHCENDDYDQSNDRFHLDEICKILDEFHNDSPLLRRFVKTLEIIDPVVLNFDLFLGDGYTLLESIHSLDDVIMFVDLLLELFDPVGGQLVRSQDAAESSGQSATE